MGKESEAAGMMARAVRLLLAERQVAFRPILARIGGGVTAGLLLSQLCYWSERTRPEAEGWIYKTMADLEGETAMGRHEQDTARHLLSERGLIEEDLRGVPPIRHFRIVWDRLDAALLELVERPQIDLPESGKLNSRKAANQIVAIRQHIPETPSQIPDKYVPPPATPVVPYRAEDPVFGAAWKLWEQALGLPPNPITKETLGEILDTFHPSLEWVQDAFREMAGANVRSLPYLRRILERWTREGKLPRAPAPPPRERRRLHEAATTPDPGKGGLHVAGPTGRRLGLRGNDEIPGRGLIIEGDLGKVNHA